MRYFHHLQNGNLVAPSRGKLLQKQLYRNFKILVANENVRAWCTVISAEAVVERCSYK